MRRALRTAAGWAEFSRERPRQTGGEFYSGATSDHTPVAHWHHTHPCTIRYGRDMECMHLLWIDWVQAVLCGPLGCSMATATMVWYSAKLYGGVL